ncbi:hypothetical protein HJA76_09770 [Rhizobium bangladeshense]|uniref:hypothetical protein n=1 Tax=Rhizobium bangladeshense TaxID=1138189 RepID=UPI001C83077B|nr:hypothetical protein [Rhizobium bangladeshense]MBX4919995.1 hypothetical protein [Rhizobium bangladeshense]
MKAGKVDLVLAAVHGLGGGLQLGLAEVVRRLVHFALEAGGLLELFDQTFSRGGFTIELRHRRSRADHVLNLATVEIGLCQLRNFLGGDGEAGSLEQVGQDLHALAQRAEFYRRYQSK